MAQCSLLLKPQRLRSSRPVTWFNMAAKSKSFDKLLLDSVDEALLYLGESARQSIYSHIEMNFKMSRNEIPQNLEHFQLALEKIFGIGSSFIEILIMKSLYAKIGCLLPMEKNEQLEFIKYVKTARKNFMLNAEPK
jgi:hypothetical protein